ncbi:MAG: DUF2809 domain-containing protein [Bryobacterales bacterium]|nr:DUF2809 domain-containing protein [Bryobacterales bacterium]
MMPGRFRWAMLAAIISGGLVSRAAHTGFILVDKYLGDALYAAMVYVILRMARRFKPVAAWTALIMAAIELFQLTGIPAGLLHSEHIAVRVGARLMGSTFSLPDLAAYAAGILCIAGVDRRLSIRNADVECTAPRVRS